MFNVTYDREISGCSERHVRRAISSNVQCLQRMCLQRKLEAHAGCVNTVSFDTEGGDVLISGSDDQQILLWDWQRGECCCCFISTNSNSMQTPLNPA
jgi:WD repeat-containing protein 42A